MKTTYYDGKKYAIEKAIIRNEEIYYMLSGMTYYVAKKDCASGLTLFFYRFFNMFDK